MEKTPRYTQRERNMVLGYAAQYKDVIENKRTDAESNRKKDEVWLQIAKEFNSKVYHQRSAKQLRQLYKNMKLLLKKDLCGEDKGNRSFMDLLNTLSQQESVAQYIAEQMSPDGGGSQSAGNGRHLADDYEDSKLPLYEGMDTDVILIKSETISDNEQTENGMDCMDDDDDDDCPSPKAPEVCLEEEDEEVLFATDLRQRLHSMGASAASILSEGLVNGGNISNNNNNNNNNNNDPLPRATSSPVCSTKTSISSTGSFMSATAPKTEITLSSVGNIRVGAFASISKTLQNETVSNNNNNNISNNNNNNISSNSNNSSSNNNNSNVDNSNNNNNGLRARPLTAEQVQQHMLLNGLGLSAVHHPPTNALQAAINASTSGVGSSRHATLQLPRLQRGHNAAATAAAATAAAAAAVAAGVVVAGNGTNSNASGVQLLLNGHQSRDKLLTQQQQQQLQQNSGISVAAGSFNGYNGLGVSNINNINNSSSNNLNNSNSNNHNNSHSSNNINNTSGNSNINNSSSSGTRNHHNEYMLTLAVEERKRKIELINAQIEYWQTLTKKLDSQSGHYPNPACLCHFPGSNLISVGLNTNIAAVNAAGNTATVNALQTQSSSS